MIRQIGVDNEEANIDDEPKESVLINPEDPENFSPIMLPEFKANHSEPAFKQPLSPIKLTAHADR